MCGYCCRAPIALIVMLEDYERWKRQGRSDILRYASARTSEGCGTLWIDADKDKELSYCPFLKKVGGDKHICTIQDTKPTVCREFWCEWSYGVGKKGIPFKTDRGWTDKARQLGYE
jgi:Fe-S-cluster containining protein